jgi:hypothetical protein
VPVPEVSAIASSGGVIYLGGTFTHVGGRARNSLAAVTASDAVTCWAPDADRFTAALAVNADTVYAGGAFRSVAGESTWSGLVLLTP